MWCEEVGVKKRKTTSYTYFKTSQQHQRKSMPHSCKRRLFTLQEQLMVRRTPSPIEERAPVNTEVLSRVPIYSSKTSFISLAPYESSLDTQEVHSAAPLMPALPTQQNIKYRLAYSLSTAFLFAEALRCSLQNFATPFNIVHKVWSSLVWALCHLPMMAWLYVTHSTFRLFTNPHSSFHLSLMLLENLTGGSFIWTRPSKAKLPLAVDTQMKYSRVELSSVKGCTNCDASAQSFSLSAEVRAQGSNSLESLNPIQVTWTNSQVLQARINMHDFPFYLCLWKSQNDVKTFLNRH